MRRPNQWSIKSKVTIGVFSLVQGLQIKEMICSLSADGLRRKEQEGKDSESREQWEQNQKKETRRANQKVQNLSKDRVWLVRLCVCMCLYLWVYSLRLKKYGKYFVKKQTKNKHWLNNNKLTNSSKILLVMVVIPGSIKHSTCAGHWVTWFHHDFSLNHHHDRMKKVQSSPTSSHRPRKGGWALWSHSPKVT